MKINNPHDSKHGPGGTVNVTGSNSRDALNAYPLASQYYSSENATYVTTNAAAPCGLPGAYQGGTVGLSSPHPARAACIEVGGEEFFGSPEYLVC